MDSVGLSSRIKECDQGTEMAISGGQAFSQELKTGHPKYAIVPAQMKHRHAKRARTIFCDRCIHRTVYSKDLVKFFLGCDEQQERNWKSIICKYNVTSVMVRYLNSKPKNV